MDAGCRTEWKYLRRQVGKELDEETDPLVFQFGLAGAIWFRQPAPSIASLVYYSKTK